MNISTHKPEDTATDARSRRHWLFGAVAGMATLGGFGLAWYTSRTTGKSHGVEADFWQHQFATPDGQILHMNSFRNKPLLLNFWATWCTPCIEELPLLSSFYTKKMVNGWQVLGLAIDELDPVKRFLARTIVAFPVAMAGSSGVDLSRSLGNSLGGLPFTVVLDASGQIVRRKMGRVTPDELHVWSMPK